MPLGLGGAGIHLVHPDGDVLFGGQPGEQVGRLEHHRTLWVGALDMGAVEFDGTFGNGIQARSHGQHRGFATAGMADQADKLAFVDLKVKVFDHGQRPLWRGIDLVQLAEIDKPFGDQPVLRGGDGGGHAVDWGDFWQDPGFGHFGVDPDFHQILGHRPAQRLERRVVVHRAPVARAGQSDGERLPQPPLGGQGQNAVGQQNRLVHIIGDQDAGLFIGLKYRQNLVRQIGAGQGIQRRQWFIQQQQIGRQRQCARHGDPLAHPA